MSLHPSGPFRPRLAGRLLPILGLVVIQACGNLTAGGFGEARVVANGDAPDPVPSPAATILAAPLRSDHDDDVNPEGELELSFRLYLESDGGRPIELSNGDDLEVSLDLQGTLEADVVTARIPSDVYSALRIDFHKVEVEVDAGVVIDGQPILGEVDVEIEDLTVERALNLTVLEGSTVEILLDLNAATWLQWVDVTTVPYSVRPEFFAEAFSVRIR